MLDARELYEDYKEGEWDDYHPITDSIGKILVEVEDKLHAISLILYKSVASTPMLGVLVLERHREKTKDPLATCKTWIELQKLVESIENSVAWFEDVKECVEYLVFDIPASDGFYTEKGKIIQFVKTCCSILKGRKEIAEIICDSPWHECVTCPPPREKLVCAAGKSGGRYLCNFVRKRINFEGTPEYIFKCKNLGKEGKMLWWMEVPELPEKEDIQNATNL